MQLLSSQQLQNCFDFGFRATSGAEAFLERTCSVCQHSAGELLLEQLLESMPKPGPWRAFSLKDRAI